MNVIEEDMPDVMLSTYPVSKDLYARNVDSNREDIIEKVKYDEIEIDYHNS